MHLNKRSIRTPMPVEQVRKLTSHLANLDRMSPDYWTFGGRDKRLGAHAMFHYPAMMVPQMQGAILDIICDAAPNTHRVLDPFVGSGTTLVEAMARGLDFTGIDINPLAILISRAKAVVLSPGQLECSAKRIASEIKADKGRAYFVSFQNQKKWFSKSSSIGISRIARAIESEKDEDVRRVFWVVLARIVRSTCNSRKSTYKLHAKQAEEGAVESVDSALEFETHSKIVISALEAHFKMLHAAEVVSRGTYSGNIVLKIGDVLAEHTPKNTELANIVITSPPYGDNRTTIPYGQYSYLPLKWIPLSDIAGNVTKGIVDNTHSTDTASLGGSAQRAILRGDEMCSSFKQYKETLEALKGNEDGQKRFAAFASDLKRSIDILSMKTASDGFHVWTVGERKIGGTPIPMAALVTEMLQKNDIQPVYTASRRILSKRMATRNTVGDTMDAEQIIIARKC
ncbi:DNA methyltransferase [Rhodoferax ferrireducens]|uniref:DNA methyltransferase n=1 Tax=Rhodoferax ferrireducens TaxID=192843 RepID=UPI00298DF49B|nr:DNA methyltransferase [Rhodoferax ferrireducens]WPC66370.1 DNA methyltransferase [Rhodoferax ferrireducens]